MFRLRRDQVRFVLILFGQVPTSFTLALILFLCCKQTKNVLVHSVEDNSQILLQEQDRFADEK